MFDMPYNPSKQNLVIKQETEKYNNWLKHHGVSCAVL